MPTKQDTLDTRVDIEQAIETVQQFARQNESRSIPTLKLFDLKNGRLELQELSSLEKTLHFVQTFSPLHRAKAKEKEKALAGTLRESVDLIKIYSSALKHMQKGTTSDQALAKRLLHAVSTYNALVRQTRNPAKSLTGRLKRFFFTMAGWKIDDELISSEIHVPETVEYSSGQPTTLLKHRVTIQKESRLTALVQNIHKLSEQEKIKPKKEELDAFRLKALTMLRNQKHLASTPLDELIYLIQTTPIESEQVEGSHGYATTVLSLQQVICPFPGEEIELSGEFQRDSFHPELCFPIKDSFKLYTRSTQSGFPHALQHIGFSLHEKLLPAFLLRPKALPEIQNLLETNHKLSQELLHQTTTLATAKRQFFARKECFNKTATLMTLLQDVMLALSNAAAIQNPAEITQFFDLAKCQDRPFEYVCHIHNEVIQKAVADPFDALQEKWLFDNSPDIADPTFCKNILEKALQKGIATFSSNDPICLCYQNHLAHCLGPAAANLYLMQLSEHLGFHPPTPTLFEKMLLTSAFRQQSLFANELWNFDATQDLQQYLTKVLEEEKALFCGEVAGDLNTKQALGFTTDLLDYFF